MLPILISLVFVILIVFLLFNAYNKLVKRRNRREQGFADIDVLLNKRYDLIPQLVETVKGYMNHEQKVMIAVAEARSGALSANSINEKIKAEKQVSRAMRGFNIAVEAYPDLKANQNFMHLQNEIAQMEDELAGMRLMFNKVTTEYNNALETFPSNLVATMGSFERGDFFDLGDAKREQLEQTPKISFD